MTGLPVGTCLQCEQTPAQIKRDQTICGIEDGHEYLELVAEWPRHHWRDWSDKELSTIKPEHRDEYRRARLPDIQYAACEHTIYGHRPAKENDPEWGLSVGQCVDCGEQVSA